jgi:hypothetical protein
MEIWIELIAMMTPNCRSGRYDGERKIYGAMPTGLPDSISLLPELRHNAVLGGDEGI